ncbi:MAG: GNAT family N-acetyltransferase [Acidimicrobiaceae bacterium]|nr:GNAT family N-acetyltransferase [Acidimicrobiaceae bacterium]
MESARVADHHDLHRIAELWADAVAELEGQRGGGLLAHAVLPDGSPLAHLRAAASRPDDVVAVGLIDEVVVGFGYGRLREAPGERIGVIEALYVEPDAREVGVGDAVAGVLVDHFDGLGCDGIDAFALPGNRKAKAFFEGHGFTARLLVMHRADGRRRSAAGDS